MIWKVVPQQPHYKINRIGVVVNAKTGHSPKVRLELGYPTVSLTTYSIPKQYHVGIHILLLSAFVGPCPPGMECRHLNGDRADFSFDNIKWGTVSQNRQDAVKHGTHVDNRGEKHGMRKLSEADVHKIRSIYAAGGYSQRVLGELFGVCQNQISLIVLGRNWKHI